MPETMDLISANPFAPERIGGDGEHKIEKGQSLTLALSFYFPQGTSKRCKNWSKIFIVC